MRSNITKQPYDIPPLLQGTVWSEYNCYLYNLTRTHLTTVRYLQLQTTFTRKLIIQLHDSQLILAHASERASRLEARESTCARKHLSLESARAARWRFPPAYFFRECPLNFLAPVVDVKKCGAGAHQMGKTLILL